MKSTKSRDTPLKWRCPRAPVGPRRAEKTELIVTLEIPKSNYKDDEDLQTLLYWSEMPISEHGYYRDIAVNVKVEGGFERTIVFTHARVRIKTETLTRSGVVTVTVRIQQSDGYVDGSGFRKPWSLDDLSDDNGVVTRDERINRLIESSIAVDDSRLVKVQ